MTTDTSAPPPELTFGQKAVGLQFNPSGSDAVAQCKQAFASIIDELHALRMGHADELARLCSIAITEAQAACMWSIKALTWNK